MNRNLRIYLLDNQNYFIDEQIIEKPETYEDLLNLIKETIPESFKMFYHDINNNIKFIHNDDDYKLINDIIFIVDSNNNNLNYEPSFYSVIYEQLSESKQEIFDNKYNCIICLSHINNENPYFCYSCQNVFHIKCLESEEKNKNEQNQILKCPTCRNELPLKDWKKNVHFEENKKMMKNY